MRLCAFVRLITAAGTMLLTAPVLAQSADLVVTISATGSLPVGGASLVFDSDLPQGAGLSSSAAIECAVPPTSP